MSNQRKRGFTLRINGLSIIMLLILLCLLTLGILSVISAHADLNLAEKNAAHISGYAESDAYAQEMLGRIYFAANSTGKGDGYLSRTAEAIRMLDGVDIQPEANSLRLSFETEKNNQITIYVELVLDENGGFETVSYRLVNG